MTTLRAIINAMTAGVGRSVLGRLSPHSRIWSSASDRHYEGADPEMDASGDVPAMRRLVSDLEQLGGLCRASTLPAVDDARITRALRARAETCSQLVLWRPRMMRWQGLTSALAVATAAVLAWILVLSPLLLGGQGASAAAARVLRAAAHTASLQPVHTLQTGQYAYTKSEGAYFDETATAGGTLWGVLVPTTREIWIAPDGSGRIRQVSDPPSFLAPGDRARWEAAGSPPLSQLSGSDTYDKYFGPGGLAFPLDIDGFHQAELLRLATDPAALSSAIRAIAASNPNPLGWEMLTIVSDILGESAAPPQLRAALYQVAATIPGIELVGTVRDRAGRSGIAVAASRSDLRLELIFDPRTSALLAKEETLRHPVADTTAPAGTPIEYTLYLASGIVASTSATAEAK